MEGGLEAPESDRVSYRRFDEFAQRFARLEHGLKFSSHSGSMRIWGMTAVFMPKVCCLRVTAATGGEVLPPKTWLKRNCRDSVATNAASANAWANCLRIQQQATQGEAALTG